MITADIVNGARFSMTTNAPQLDVDNATRADPDCLARVVGRMDGLVETDWRLNLFLEFGVVDHVLIVQRLFDHHQVVSIHLFEHTDVGKRVRRIRVTHQIDFRKRGSYLPYDIDIPARFDLDLDTAITGFDLCVDLCQQL